MQVTLKTNDDVRAGIGVFINGPIAQDNAEEDVPSEDAQGVVSLWRELAASEGENEVTADVSVAYDAKRLLSSEEVAFGLMMTGLSGQIKDPETVARGLDNLALQIDHEIARLTDQEGPDAVADAMVPEAILALVRESDTITEEEFHQQGVQALTRLSERVRSEQVSA